MARTGQPSRERVASTERSLAILDVLASAESFGTNEIAKRTNATASSVSRQLGTLVAAQLVEYVADTGRYRLGIRIVELASRVLERLDVRDVARPHLHALAEAVSETVTLSVPADRHAVTVDFVASDQAVQGVTRIGRPSVAHATAAGKIMLAFTDRRPDLPLTAYTAKTITDPALLEIELDRIRRRGWADAYEERDPELNAIAAPVWGSRQELAAIVAIQGPIPRFGRGPARKALPLLVELTNAISQGLGAGRT